MPYIDQDYHYHERPWKDAYERLEADLERPLRVLGARWRTWAPTPWTAEQARAAGNADLDDANERGLTLVVAGTLHTPRLHRLVIPDEWAAPGDEGNPIRGHGYGTDALVYPTDDQEPLALPLYVNDNTEVIAGEIGDRLVLWNGHYSAWTALDVDGFVARAFEQALDEDGLGDLRERLAEMNKQRFLKVARRATNEGMDQLHTEIGELMRAHSKAQAKVAKTQHDLKSRQLTLDALRQRETEEYGDVEASIEESWTRLNNDERLTRVHFNGDHQLLLETVPLDITHPTTGESVYLGRFRWTIDLDDDAITVVNLDNAKGGFDHPHVFMNSPCFGEMGATIYQLLRAGQFHPAVEMVFVFLGSINLHDDWSRRAQFWFDEANVRPEAEVAA